MNSEIQVRLLDAVGVCLRPLVRMLLLSGISYRQFDEIVKTAFVAESFGDRDPTRRRTNVSRVAVRTGLSRKEVARIRDGIDSRLAGETASRDIAFHSGHAARLLQVWHTDPRFLGPAGQPRVLSFDGDAECFSTIVKSVGGDVPAGAVRAELLAAGAMEELPDGKLRVLKRHFIPGDLGEELVVGFRHIVAPVLDGLSHNLCMPKSEAFIQRVSYSENLPRDTIPRFKRLAHERAAEFVQSIDEWLSSNERALVDSEAGEARVGVGVFYFEQPSAQKD
jgi:hypothetical protein